jgi:ABC-type polysaccharide/polyol phosphate transport system ATPase subunit
VRLPSEFTGRDNIYMNAGLWGLRGLLDERIDDILTFSEIRILIDLPVKIYSPGWR